MTTQLAVTDRAPLQMQRAETVDPFEPQDWKGLLELARMVSGTDFAPPAFKGKPEACAIAMMYGKQVGISGLQAIQNIAVINGRPSLYGDAFWAVIISHPQFEDVTEISEDTKATVILKRRGRTPKEVTFTQQDAQKAALWDKAGPWKQYPKLMMLWRARTIAARSLFADALKGITTSYEAEDSSPIIDAKVSESSTSEVIQATAGTVELAAKITQDEAREFGKAWKASGFTIAEAKAHIKDAFGVESSLDLLKSKHTEAMQWATKNPAWPDVQSPDEERSRQAFGILGYDLIRQAEVIRAHTQADGKVDWSTLFISLTAEINAA